MAETVLRERFRVKGFGVKSYAKAYQFDHAVLSRVLDGISKAKNKNATLQRKIILQLQADGIWTDALPWKQ